jgi:hypothetical protein
MTAIPANAAMQQEGIGGVDLLGKLAKPLTVRRVAAASGQRGCPRATVGFRNMSSRSLLNELQPLQAFELSRARTSIGRFMCFYNGRRPHSRALTE